MFPSDVRFAFIYDGEIKQNKRGGRRKRVAGKEWKKTDSDAVRGREGNANKMCQAGIP